MPYRCALASSPLLPPSPSCSGLAFNTGLFAARNVPAARAMLREWAGMLVDPTKEQADDPMHRGIDDQLALNNILDSGGIVSSSEGEGWPFGWGGEEVEVGGGQGLLQGCCSRQQAETRLLFAGNHRRSLWHAYAGGTCACALCRRPSHHPGQQSHAACADPAGAAVCKRTCGVCAAHALEVRSP